MQSSFWGAILGLWVDTRAVATGFCQPLRRAQGWLEGGGNRPWRCTWFSPITPVADVHSYLLVLQSLPHDQPYQLMIPRQLERLGFGQDEYQGCYEGQLPPTEV